MLNPANSPRGNQFVVPRGDMLNEGLHQMELLNFHAKKLEEGLKKQGLKIKHHENNMEFLKTQINKLDESILDMQASLGKYHSMNVAKASNQTLDDVHTEQNTVDQISRQEKTAASLFCKLSLRGSQPNAFPKDALGVVATLGNVQNDNLSRIFSEYLGLETMLAIVCKTYEGVKAFEIYDSDGNINQAAGIHGLGAAISKPINGRFLVICLEDLRPYVGDIVTNDPQKKLDLLKPRLPSGKCPHGFLGFAVNMINVDSRYLSCITSAGHGLRETLFYSLFSRLQVYRTRKEMRDAVPCISDGALSLDGGMIKSTGVFSLGNSKGIEVRFPVGSGLSDYPTDIITIEEKLRLSRWERERISEDMLREATQMHHATNIFNQKQEEYSKFISQHPL